MRRLHISNSGNRNAVVVGKPAAPPEKIVLGKAGDAATFRRYLAAGEGFMFADLSEKLGEDISTALIEGDPEIDFLHVGQFIESTTSMLTTSDGEPMYASPKVMEVTYDALGVETGRKEPVDVASTVNDVIPIRWTGKKLPRNDVAKQFMFKRTIQLQHVDGVTFDFLYGMAKELDEEDVMVLLGAGESGKDPIVLQLNGTAYRGFLEGRVNGESFILLLHLSNMELKKPVEKPAKSEGEDK